MKIEKLILLLFGFSIFATPVFSIDISNCADLTESGQTYYFTQDITNSAEKYCMNISGNNIILDCQGYVIDGNGQAADIGINFISNNSLAKNCSVDDWKYNVYFQKSYNSTIRETNDTSGLTQYMVYAVSSYRINIINVSGWASERVFYFANSENFTLRNNTLKKTSQSFAAHTCLSVSGSTLKRNQHNIDTSNFCEESQTGFSKPLMYYDNITNVCPSKEVSFNDSYAGLWFVGCDGISVTNSFVFDGFRTSFTTNSNFSGINSSYVFESVVLQGSDDNVFDRFHVYKPGYDGFQFAFGSDRNVINNSNVTGFNTYGVDFNSGTYNIVTNSNFSSSSSAYCFYLNSDNNDIYGNVMSCDTGSFRVLGGDNNNIYNNIMNNANYLDFISTLRSQHWNTTNQTGTRITSSGTNIGGNYWTNSSSDGYSDVCTDADTDGFCDVALNVSSRLAVVGGDYSWLNIDYLPLSNKYSAGAPPSQPSLLLKFLFGTSSTLGGKSLIEAWP